MKANLFITLATTLSILAGCTNDDDQKIDNWNGEIRLSSGIAVQTRAGELKAPDTQIAQGQHVGVFIDEASENAATAIGANLKYDADGNGGLTLATDPAQASPYYPTSGNGVKIVAYQPYNASAALTGDGYDFLVNADQSQQIGNSESNYYNSDLLYSAREEAYARQAETHNLEFKHKLSKVVCTLVKGNGLDASALNGATVSIVNAETKGTFKPSDGSFSTKTSTEGQQSDVKMNSTITSGSYIAVIPPQTFTKDAKFLKVTLASEAVFYYKIPNGAGDNDLVLSEGNVYKYNIKVNLTGLTVTSSIAPWEGGDQATEGNAEM